MATIITREVGATAKGSPLSNAEVDNNFINLNEAKVEKDNAQYLDFDITATNTGGVAKVVWNDGDGTLEFGLKGGNVTLQIGQEQVQRVYNASGVNLTDGQVVYITGAQGNRVSVKLANALTEAASSKTFGLVTEPIANGAEGFVTTGGLVRNINTSAYPEGSALWLSTTDGAVTTTKPSAPVHSVLVGWVVRSHASVGAIFVHIQNGYELSELHDVYAPSPSDGQLLKWVNSNQRWEPSFDVSLNTVSTKSLDLKAVTAESLHRSPNAVTAMFVYDTSKDSDGGAWTEKCQHTSWYNEALNGKWLGAWVNEATARSANATQGSELIDAAIGVAGSTYLVRGTSTAVGGGFYTLTTTSVASSQGVVTATNDGLLTVGKTYLIVVNVSAYSAAANGLQVRPSSGQGSGVAVSVLTMTGAGTYTLAYTPSGSNDTLTFQFGNVGSVIGDTVTFKVSVREVISQTTQTGDYFQLTTDGKFYKLNDTSGVTEVFRGNKRDFPRLAGIVAEAGNVNIYDLTEPGRPMWMRFAYATNFSSWCYINGITVSGVAAQNGTLGITHTGNGGCFSVLKFPTDFVDYYRTANNYGNWWVSNGIANRHSITAPNATNRAISPLIGSGAVGNAVAMTVLPDAPVDPVTGLKVPTIAVATAGGVSVIKHNGTVVNSSSVQNFSSITLDENRIFGSLTSNTGHIYRTEVQTKDLAASFVLENLSQTAAPDISRTGASKNIAWGRRNLRRGHNNGMVSGMRHNEGTDARSATLAITSLFNTGHQPGDIRRTYLSDNVVESVGPSVELAPPITSANGWSVVGDWFTINEDGTVLVSGGTVNSYLRRAFFNLVPGKTYSVQVSSAGSSGIGFRLQFGDVRHISDYFWNGSGAFTPAADSIMVGVFRYSTHTGTATITNISVQEVVADRSYKAQGANIIGTLTKSEVASAAELVAYSGFSTTDYLQEPYSADLDFGTGEWSVGAWVNVPVTLPAANFLANGPERISGGDFEGGLVGTKADGNGSVSTWALNTTDPISGTQDGRLTITSGSTMWRPYLQFSSPGKTFLSVYELTFDYKVLSGTALLSWVFNGSAIVTVNLSLTGTGKATVRYVAAGSTGGEILYFGNSACDIQIDNFSVKEVAPALIADRAYSSGAKLNLGVDVGGRFTATAHDGTTTRTVTTTASYNTGTWLKAEATYKSGKLAILVNGVEVANTTGIPLLTLNNPNAVLTIGNSYNLDAPFPGSIALLKLSATVPTADQSLWMYEQEKQMFREGAQVCLPDSGSIVDLAYDEATDKWIAASASNISEWSGLVRTNVRPVSAGSYSKLASNGGIVLESRTSTNPGVDITMPSYNIREELVRRAEAAAKSNAQLATFDYVGGFTASTTTGSTAITSVASLSYPVSYVGAKVTGSGIPSDTTIISVSGTTIYLDKAATATATNVQISFTDFILPVGYEAKVVSSAGVFKQEGSTKDFTRLFDGFKETIRFAVAPGYQTWVQIQAVRSQS